MIVGEREQVAMLPSDEVLAGIVQRDPASPAAEVAFAAIYERHFPRLTRLAASERGYIDCAVDPEDTAQITMLKAWKGIHSFDPEKGTFGQWLCGATHHAMIDAHRKASSNHSFPVAIDEISTFSGEPAAADRAMDGLSLADTLEALEDLPEEQRRALGYRLLDVTDTEVARIEEKPLGTVKGRARLAAKAGQKRLEAAANPV